MRGRGAAWGLSICAENPFRMPDRRDPLIVPRAAAAVESMACLAGPGLMLRNTASRAEVLQCIILMPGQ